MARSGRRDVMEYHCLRQFRRRQLLAFLRRSNLPATFDALKHETRVFFDLRFLERLVVDGRWQEAREYIHRFFPCREGDDQELVDVHTALRFITHFNVLDDLAQGKLGGDEEDVERQIEAIPSTMADRHYTEAVRRVFSMGTHPAYWDPVDWHLIRLKAAEVVKDLIMRTPEFRHLLQLPRCPSNPCNTIPFGFGGYRRHKRKKMGQMPASLLALHFLRKERRPSSTWNQGLSCEPMDLEGIIGIPGSPVGSFIGKSCGISPTNAVTKRLGQQCYAESASGAKVKPTTGEFCPDVIDAPSSVGIDPMIVLEKINDLGDISDAMATLLRNTCTYGPDHRMFVEKLLEQEKLLYELRVDCIKAKLKGCTSTGNFSTR